MQGGKAIRISPRPGTFGAPDPEREAVLASMNSEAGPDVRRRFFELQRNRSEGVLSAPLEQLYEVREVPAEVPPRARVMASVDCAACGEPTMETRIRRLYGDLMCAPCFEERLSGRMPLDAPSRRPGL